LREEDNEDSLDDSVSDCGESSLDFTFACFTVSFISSNGTYLLILASSHQLFVSFYFLVLLLLGLLIYQYGLSFCSICTGPQLFLVATSAFTAADHAKTLPLNLVKLYEGKSIMELDACGLKLEPCALGLEACYLLLESL
jgi:hypothetical protein